jgi:hypothetical protein
MIVRCAHKGEEELFSIADECRPAKEGSDCFGGPRDALEISPEKGKKTA